MDEPSYYKFDKSFKSIWLIAFTLVSKIFLSSSNLFFSKSILVCDIINFSLYISSFLRSSIKSK